jgi:adenine deaminase
MSLCGQEFFGLFSLHEKQPQTFLALPVIPELKLTDKGLVDVNQFKFAHLFI